MKHPLEIFLILRRIGPKGDEVTGEWRKLHNEELSDLYSLPNIVIPRLTKIIHSGITFVSRNLR